MTARPSIARLADAPVPHQDSWPTRKPPSVAITALQMQAGRSARAMIKHRARDYLVEPWQLDMLRHGFLASQFEPVQLIEFAEELLCVTAIFHRCEIVPVQKINARAALLTGRYLRAKARRPA